MKRLYAPGTKIIFTRYAPLKAVKPKKRKFVKSTTVTIKQRRLA